MEKIYTEPDRTRLINCLTKLGFSDTDPLVNGIQANQPVDLDAPGIHMLTPLKIAIQRLNINDKEAFKILHSYSSIKSQNLTNYDKAVINEVVHGKTKSGWFGASIRKDLPVSNYSELVQCFQVFYKELKITAAQIRLGLAAMSRQIFFLGEIDVFRNHLSNIKSNILPIIEATINEVKPKIVAEIIAEAQDKDIKPEYDSQRVFKEAINKLENRFPRTIYTDLYAFGDQIIAYSNPETAPKEFFVFSENILSGIYTGENLPSYFNCLKIALEKKVKKVSFGISTGNYEFNLDYDEGKWIYDDLNHLEEGRKLLSEKEVMQLLFKYHSIEKSPLIFSAKPYVALEENLAFNQAIDSLKSIQEWHSLHVLKEEQYSEMNASGFTLLSIAAQNGDITTVNRCLNSKIRYRNQYPWRYDLALKSELKNNNDSAKIGIIYLSTDSTYVVRDPWGTIQTGVLPKEISLKDLNISLNDTELKKSILDVTSEVKHTNKWKYTPLYIAAQNGHLKVVTAILEHLKSNDSQEVSIVINEESMNGITPLCAAALHGHSEIAKVLLAEPGLKMIERDAFYQILCNAALKNYTEIIQLLFAAIKNSLSAIEPKSLLFILSEAAKNGHIEFVKLLFAELKDYPIPLDIKIEAFLNLVLKKNEVVVSKAITTVLTALNDDKDAIKKVINKENNDGNTPLLNAAVQGNHQGIRALLSPLYGDKDAMNDVLNRTSNTNLSAISVAADKEDMETLMVLLTANENADTQNEAQILASLLIAAGKGDIEAITKLSDLDKNIIRQPNAQAQILASLLLAAKQGNNKAVIALLTAVNDENQLKQQLKELLSFAVTHDKTEVVKALLTVVKGSLIPIEERIETSLNLILQDKDIEIVVKGIEMMFTTLSNNKDLIKKVINKENNKGATPLLNAVKQSRPEVIKALLAPLYTDKDAMNDIVNRASNTNLSAISIAASKGDMETLMELFTADKDVDTQKEAKILASLLIAAEDGDPEKITELCDVDKNTVIQPKLQEQILTSFSLAAKQGNTNAVIALLAAINNKNGLKQQLKTALVTSLLFAAKEGNTHAVTELLDNENELKQGLEEPLLLATQNNHSATVNVLIDALKNEEDEITPENKVFIRRVLHTAATEINPDTAKALSNALRNKEGEIAPEDKVFIRGALRMVGPAGKADTTKVLIDALRDKKNEISYEEKVLIIEIIFNTATNDRTDTIEVLLAAIEGNNEAIKKGIQAGKYLHSAAEHNYIEFVTIMLAALNGDQEAIKEVIHQEDDTGETPLSIAIKNNNSEIVKALLKADYTSVLVSLQKRDGTVPTMLESLKGDKEAIQNVLALEDNKERPLLLYAAEENDISTLEVVLKVIYNNEMHYQKNVQDQILDAMLTAADCGNTEAAKVLREKPGLMGKWINLKQE